MSKGLTGISSIAVLALFLSLAACNQGSNLTGSLSGASTSSSSSPVQSPASCSFNGQTVASGKSISVYSAQNVPYGSTCASVTESITCNNGNFPVGTYYSSCVVSAPAACSFNSQNIASGASVTAYQNSQVPFGSSCVSQNRTCNNGVLGGTYTFASCAVGQPAACIFNGQNVANGQSINVFTAQTVPYGSVCTSVEQSITCNNGSFPSGTFYPACTVSAPASCTFNGLPVANGSSVTAYQAASVPYGSTCVSQGRICTNGTLAGSYAYSACTVSPPPPPTKFAITSAVQSVYAGECSAPVTIQTENSSGTTQNATSNITVLLTDSPSTALFYSDSKCTAAISSFAIASGSSSGTFYFSPTGSGSLSITVADQAGALASATQQETIVSRLQVIQATASSAVGVASVDFYVNNQTTPTCHATTPASGSTYNCNWTVPPGAGLKYTLQTKATDINGKVGTSSIVTVTSQ